MSKSIVGDLRIRVKELAKEYDGVLGPDETICSDNTKTGSSLNFPHITCRPTSVCADLCYGAMPGKPITWINSLKKYLRVYRYFLETPPDEVADRIHTEYVKRKMTFLRWNGVGDLFPESAAVVGQITKRHPDDVLLVVTRKPEMVSLIPRDAENLYLMFSLDGSKDSVPRKADALRRRHPRMFFSFLRRRPDEDTMGARIVFNAQQSKKILPFDDSHTVCPVDADKIPVKGACANCRKCFRPDVLDGKHHPGPMSQFTLPHNKTGILDQQQEGEREMSTQISKSEHVYIVYAKRNTSQFDQTLQEIRCHVLDAHCEYILVESLKRYNKKYAGAAKTQSGTFKGMPVRRVNKDQILKIVDETTGKEVKWATIRRREGTQKRPGRARGGK